jgi:hypothetical protein
VVEDRVVLRAAVEQRLALRLLRPGDLQELFFRVAQIRPDELRLYVRHLDVRGRVRGLGVTQLHELIQPGSGVERL